MDLPHTFVINMESRDDRLQHIQKEFAAFNIERIEGPHTKPGWKGCTIAHRKCIELAKQRGYPWVLILEDDATLRPEALNRFKKLLPLLWESHKDWDIFNGGFTDVHKAFVLLKTPPLFLATGWAAHFYLVPSTSYDKILHIVKKVPKMPIDVYYNTPPIKIICTYPHLSFQKPGKSDNLEKYADYTTRSNKSNKTLQKLLIQKIVP